MAKEKTDWSQERYDEMVKWRTDNSATVKDLAKKFGISPAAFYFAQKKIFQNSQENQEQRCEVCRFGHTSKSITRGGRGVFPGSAENHC